MFSNPLIRHDKGEKDTFIRYLDSILERERRWLSSNGGSPLSQKRKSEITVMLYLSIRLIIAGKISATVEQ